MAQPTASISYVHATDVYTLTITGTRGEEFTDLLYRINKSNQALSDGTNSVPAGQGRMGVTAFEKAVAASAAPAVPTAPSGLYVLKRTTTTATIAFTPGRDCGSAITNYQYKIGAGAWTSLSPVDVESPVTITGLSAGATVSIQLRAVNGVGNGAASGSLSVTTLAA